MSTSIRSYGEKYYGFQSVPKPPAHIWAEMETAGRTNDDIALGIAHAKYVAWLTDQGITQPHQGRPERADEAAQ